jgi:hypothetical protein
MRSRELKGKKYKHKQKQKIANFQSTARVLIAILNGLFEGSQNFKDQAKLA